MKNSVLTLGKEPGIGVELTATALKKYGAKVL